MKLTKSSITSSLASALLLGMATTVSADEDQLAMGKLLFEETAGEMGCAACHSIDGSGDVGPDIRGLDDLDITAAFQSVMEMQFLRSYMAMNGPEVKAIGAWIEQL